MCDTCGPGCDRLREAGPELALGVLPAHERATALAHLDHCAGCRAEVHRLTLVGDALLGLVPGSEPPVGFEDRVMARLGPALRPARRLRRRRRAARALAAAAAALAVGAGGWALGGSTASPAPAAPPVSVAAQLRSAPLTDGSRTLGQAFVHGGSSRWVYLSVDADGARGPVRCTVLRGDGSSVAIGSFPLKDGYGYWGAPYPAGPAVTGVRLLAPDGSALATAGFGTPGG